MFIENKALIKAINANKDALLMGKLMVLRNLKTGYHIAIGYHPFFGEVVAFGVNEIKHQKIDAIVLASLVSLPSYKRVGFVDNWPFLSAKTVHKKAAEVIKKKRGSL